MKLTKMKPAPTKLGAAVSSPLAPTAPSPAPGLVQAPTHDLWTVPEDWLARLPFVHLLLYGDSGSGKSTVASTFVRLVKALGKPMLIMAFDPYGKMAPYRELGVVQPVNDPAFVEYYAQLGLLAEDVVDQEDGTLLARIEYYLDPDPDRAQAADQIEQRLTGFHAQAPSWSTIVLDSLTFFQYASLRKHRERLPIDSNNPGQSTNLAWYNFVKMDVERLVKSQALWWMTNVVAIFHTSEEKTEFADTLTRGILAVGKLQSELPPGFDEMYRMKVLTGTKDGQEHRRVMQTRHDTIWAATSVTAKAPNPCAPNFDSMWEGYIKARE